MEKLWNKWNGLNKKGKAITVVFALVVLWAIYNQIG
tara:strand:- start:132 stop:239 length:108 start_codon:yes stop_codon:yes gene_type:complete